MSKQLQEMHDVNYAGRIYFYMLVEQHLFP